MVYRYIYIGQISIWVGVIREIKGCSIHVEWAPDNLQFARMRGISIYDERVSYYATREYIDLYELLT